MTNTIHIWTDGSAHNATNSRGGYGIVIVNGTTRQFSGGSYNHTTSARMEIMGVIKALEKCESNGSKIIVYCDNQYVCNCIDKGWAFKWAKEKWRGRKNADLLKKLVHQYNRLNGLVKLQWVRGHDNNEHNELADRLASLGSQRKKIIHDMKT